MCADRSHGGPITPNDQANYVALAKKLWYDGCGVSWKTFNGQYVPQVKGKVTNFTTNELPLYRGTLNGRAKFDWDIPGHFKADARNRAKAADTNRTCKAGMQAIAKIFAEPLRQADNDYAVLFANMRAADNNVDAFIEEMRNRADEDDVEEEVEDEAEAVAAEIGAQAVAADEAEAEAEAEEEEEEEIDDDDTSSSDDDELVPPRADPLLQFYENETQLATQKTTYNVTELGRRIRKVVAALDKCIDSELKVDRDRLMRRLSKGALSITKTKASLRALQKVAVQRDARRRAVNNRRA